MIYTLTHAVFYFAVLYIAAGAATLYFYSLLDIELSRREKAAWPVMGLVLLLALHEVLRNIALNKIDRLFSP